jgi:DNA processing protein
VDRALWLHCLALPHSLRARWVRDQLEHGQVREELRALADSARTRARAAPSAETLDALCARHAIRWLTPLDDDYPRHALAHLHDPPAVLFVRGDLGLLGQGASVAVVGARRGTARGRRTATRLGAELGRAGVAVVSGLALGIDACAHEGCVDADGRAIVVLPRGLDRAYPVRHALLYRRVLQRGLAVSEYFPGTDARKEQFVARNRLVAAFAQIVVVVEASERSGALHTAEFAHQLGREVMAVPGPVDCPHAVGTLDLLHAGAGLVRGAHDVLAAMGLHAPARGRGPLGLDHRPESAMEIARRLGWTLPRVLAALGEAEVLGLVQRAGADRWIAASSLPRPVVDA